MKIEERISTKVKAQESLVNAIQKREQELHFLKTELAQVTGALAELREIQKEQEQEDGEET